MEACKPTNFRASEDIRSAKLRFLTSSFSQPLLVVFYEIISIAVLLHFHLFIAFYPPLLLSVRTPVPIQMLLLLYSELQPPRSQQPHIINHGADIAATTSNGWTPLNSASDSGHLEVVKLLLDKGADIAAATSNG